MRTVVAITAELSRARRGTKSKKIWLSMHPRNFGSDRPSVPEAYQCKITQSTGMATQMQREVFFDGKSQGH